MAGGGGWCACGRVGLGRVAVGRRWHTSSGVWLHRARAWGRVVGRWRGASRGRWLRSHGVRNWSMRVARSRCNRCDSLGLSLGDSHSDGRLSRAVGSRSNSRGDGVGRRSASWRDRVARGLAVGRRRRSASRVDRVALLRRRRSASRVDRVALLRRGRSTSRVGGVALLGRGRSTSRVDWVAGVALLRRRNLGSVDWVDRVAVGGGGSAGGWLGALVTASVDCRSNGDGNVRWRQVGRVNNRLVITRTNRGRAWHKDGACAGVSCGDVLGVSWGRHRIDRDTGGVPRRRDRRRVRRVAGGWVNRVA